jgi:hypothetical protein
MKRGGRVGPVLVRPAELACGEPLELAADCEKEIRRGERLLGRRGTVVPATRLSTRGQEPGLQRWRGILVVSKH